MKLAATIKMFDIAFFTQRLFHFIEVSEHLRMITDNSCLIVRPEASELKNLIFYFIISLILKF